MSGKKDMTPREEYIGDRHRQRRVMLVLVAVAAVVTMYSVSVTQYPLSFSQTLGIIADGLTGAEGDGYTWMIEHSIIWDDYIPRVLGGFLIGAILGVAGAVMQSIINNPLADPYTTGISSGASFGVALFISYGISILPLSGNAGLIVNAFIFALIPAVVIIIFAALGRASSNMMILTGVGVMMVFSAMNQMIMFSAQPDAVSEIYEWNVGSLRLLESNGLPILVVAIVLLLVVTAILSKRIVILGAGDKTAMSLGVNPKYVRIACFLTISLCVAMAVCFSGSIGFIGLVIPHICRIVLGPGRNSIFLSGVVGGLMLVICDAIARTIILGGLPVGVVTAAIGSPLLIYFLVKSRRHAMYS